MAEPDPPEIVTEAGEIVPPEETERKTVPEGTGSPLAFRAVIEMVDEPSPLAVTVSGVAASKIREIP